MKIKLYNKIAKCGTDIFNKDIYNVADTVENPDAIMVRSAVMHDMEFGDNLKAIARAGAGVNNIPLTSCADQGIVVFNTPGANANSVMELALCGMLLACRDIVGGINWVQTIKGCADVAKLVEKGKSQFAGHEIYGKKLGIIGLGAIGGPLANAARKLGMQVYGCDPFISIDAAWRLDSNIVHVDGSIAPLRDIETINLELIFSDLEILERRIAKVAKQARMDKTLAKEMELLEAIKAHLEDSKMARTFEVPEDEDMQVKWRYFLKTLGNPDMAFADVMEGIKTFLLPVWEAIVTEDEHLNSWKSITLTWEK